MANVAARWSWKKRIVVAIVGAVCFLMVFVFAIRVTVREILGGIASSKATGLSAMGWDIRNMWTTGVGGYLQKGVGSYDNGDGWIARSADLAMRSSAFDNSVASLHRIVTSHRGYLEDLRTESRTGSGRSLAAAISVPTEEFDGTLAQLQTLGRVEEVSQAGEDAAVKLATATRHFESAKTNLSRLQKLQHDRKGELRDAVALEKDIAQANEATAEAEREREALISTVAQAHFRVALMEDYRAPLRIGTAGAWLQVRNAFAEGIGTIVSSVGGLLAILLSYGLPIVFWIALLFFPIRFTWRRLHRPEATALPA